MEKGKKTASKNAVPTKEENQSMLQDLFLNELRDIYWAEKHLVKALPKMEKAATSEELATAFADHLAITQEQVTRLEQVFEMMGADTPVPDAIGRSTSNSSNIRL